MRLVKRGRRKLGHTYAQPVQKRLGRVSVEGFFFFLVKLFFALLSSTFMRVVFTPVDFDVKQF